MCIKLLYASLILFILTSCDTDGKRAKSGTYIGGEIVNPTSDYLILKKDNQLVDSIKLDNNDRFLYKLDTVEDGLYSINHNEQQLIYLETGDSLLFRINTLEFDETMTFSGIGAAENNLIIQLFLQNELENTQMIQEDIYQENPENFNNYILDLKKEREQLFSDFLKKQEVSSEFEKIAEAIIKYDFCARKEVYPTSHFGDERLKYMESLSEDFYNCRKKTDFNDASLINLYSYQRFLNNYFNQASYREYYKSEPYNPQSFTHNLFKLRLIESKVENEKVESFLLTRTIKNYLANSNDKKGGETLYEMYMTHIASDVDRKEIKELYEANKNIERGKRIPDERLVNINKDTLTLRKVINKPTFIFFWSIARKAQAQRSQRLAQSLIKKYPEYTYLAINIGDPYEKWIKTAKRYNFELSNQFEFTDKFEEISNDLAINSLLKTFIVDKKGFIVNAHANLFSSDFENDLLQNLNQ